MTERLPKPDFKTKDNLVYKWQNYGEMTQDAYTEYHWASMIVLISHLIEAKMEPQYGKVWNNLWCIILGLSTISGKTTSGKAILDHGGIISDERLAPFVHPLSVKITPEAMTHAFSQSRRRLHFVDEASGIFISMSRDHAKELNQDFIKVYDGTKMERQAVTQNEGKPILALNPRYSALWNTTPDNFARVVEREQFASGFLLRPFFIMPRYEKELKEDMPASDEAKKLREEIIVKLVKLCGTIGSRPVLFSENKIISKWKIGLRQQYAKSNRPDIENQAMGRSFELARKIAMNLTLASDEFYRYALKEKTGKGNVAGLAMIHYEIPDTVAEFSCLLAEQYFFQTTLSAYRLATNKGRCAEVIEELKHGRLSRTEISIRLGKFGDNVAQFIKDVEGDYCLKSEDIQTPGAKKKRTVYWIEN